MSIAIAERQVLHPIWLRVTHWLNVLAVLVMVMSGWRIYNASPIFAFDFPNAVTLGGWLGGALLWHFAAMWVLVLNGLVYLGCSIGSGRFRRQLLPLTPLASCVISPRRCVAGSPMPTQVVTTPCRSSPICS